MLIKAGTKYQISETIREIYNRADTLTVVRANEKTVQFILGNGKGHGAMPVQHLNYLLKRSDLKEIQPRRMFVSEEEADEEIS